TPATIISELLASDPEAASLLAKASNCRALAACSAACARRRSVAFQTARLACEQLRHRLRPHGGHSVHFVSGSLLVVVLGAGLATLDVIELSGLPGVRSVPLALAAAAVWLTGAWLAAIAVRRQRWA